MFYNDVELGLLTYKKINAPVLNEEGNIQFYINGSDTDFSRCNWEPTEYRKYRDDEVGRICKKYGAGRVLIFDGDKLKEEIRAPECKTHVYYNGPLNCFILLYRITKDDRFIRNMAKQNFLIPVRIMTKKDGYPEIKYLSSTKKGSDTRYHVLFSDHEEYNKWKKATGGVGFNDLIQITAAKIFSLDKAHGGNRTYELCINPYGNKLILEKEKRRVFYQSVKEKQQRRK